MSLAIFDLDNTLLNGDSDYLWGQFLIEQGVVDGPEYERENDRFYSEYKQGKLDIFEFLRFALRPLAEHKRSQLENWHHQFMKEKIAPIILDKGRELIEQHHVKGDTLMIITATNRFVTGPIAEELGIKNLLATEPEIIDNQYTGEVSGTPCYREGKVTRLNEWLQENNMSLQDSWFYSDSRNDISLLEKVSNPVAVDPDETLKRYAQDNNWPIISLR